MCNDASVLRPPCLSVSLALTALALHTFYVRLETFTLYVAVLRGPTVPRIGEKRRAIFFLSQRASARARFAFTSLPEGQDARLLRSLAGVVSLVDPDRGIQHDNNAEKYAIIF